MNNQDNTELVIIDQEPIELFKILKIAGITSGGQGKLLIAEGYVELNGEIETRKRKKIYGGDVVAFEDYTFNIQLSEHATPAQQPTHKILAQANAQTNKPTKNKTRKKSRPKLS